MDAATAITASAAAPAPAAPSAAVPHAGVSFHDILSALNPLQYLPVVGTIYRAVTGDMIPEPMRIFGSIAASGIMGGPVGMLMNLGSTILQKVAGIDTDEIAHRVLAAVGVLAPDAPSTQVAHVQVFEADDVSAPTVEAGDVADAARGRQAADAYGKALALAA